MEYNKIIVIRLFLLQKRWYNTGSCEETFSNEGKLQRPSGECERQSQRLQQYQQGGLKDRFFEDAGGEESPSCVSVKQP